MTDSPKSTPKIPQHEIPFFLAFHEWESLTFENCRAIMETGDFIDRAQPLSRVDTILQEHYEEFLESLRYK